MEETVDFLVFGPGQNGTFWWDNHEVCWGPEGGRWDGWPRFPIVIEFVEKGASNGHLAGGFCGVERCGFCSVVGAGDRKKVEGPLFSAESLEVMAGDERAHAKSDHVDATPFFDLIFDMVAQFGREVFETVASVSWFERWREGFDAPFVECGLHGFEDRSGVPESVDEEDEWGRVGWRFCASIGGAE